MSNEVPAKIPPLPQISNPASNPASNPDLDPLHPDYPGRPTIEDERRGRNNPDMDPLHLDSPLRPHHDHFTASPLASFQRGNTIVYYPQNFVPNVFFNEANPSFSAWELTHPGLPRPVSGGGLGGASILLEWENRNEQYAHLGIGAQHAEITDNILHGLPHLSSRQCLEGGIFAGVMATATTAIITYGPWLLRGAIVLLAL